MLFGLSISIDGYTRSWSDAILAAIYSRLLIYNSVGCHYQSKRAFSMVLISKAVWADSINRWIYKKLQWRYVGRHLQSTRAFSRMLICNVVWAVKFNRLVTRKLWWHYVGAIISRSLRGIGYWHVTLCVSIISRRVHLKSRNFSYTMLVAIISQRV